MENKMQQILA